MYSCTRTARIAQLAGRLVRLQTDGSIFSGQSHIPTIDPQQKKSPQSVPINVVDSSKLGDENAIRMNEAPTSFIPQYSTRKSPLKMDSTAFEPKSGETSPQPNVRKLTPKISMFVPPKNLSVLAHLQPTSEPIQNKNTRIESMTSKKSTFDNFMVEPDGPVKKDKKAASSQRMAQPVSHGALLDMEKQWEDMVKLAQPFEEMPGPWSFKLIHSILKYVPIIGTQITASSMIYLMEMIGAHLAWQQKVVPFFQLYEQYGPIVRLQGLFGGDILFLSRPEHIEAVYRQEGRYPVRSSLDSIEQYRLKHRKQRTAGPFIMSGPEWEDLRTKLETPLKNSVVQYRDMIEEVADDFVTRIRDIRNKQEEVPKNFQSEILKWGLESMCLVAYNKRLGCLADVGPGMSATTEAARMMEAMSNAITALRACESYIQWWRFFEAPSWKKLVASCDEIDGITSKHIRVAQNRLRAKREADDRLLLLDNPVEIHNSGQPLLDTLLLNEHMLPEDIMTVVLDMMLIGVSSTCHAITFLLYHLAKSPRVQRQIYEEIRAVAPDRADKLSYEVLKKMPLLQASVRESLRLNPPIPSMTRVLPRDIAIHNYRIPKGTYVVMTSHVASLKEENFEDATKFKPERWLSDHEDIHPFAAMPFGSGLRSCIGRGLAELQLWMLTAKIIRNFRIEYHYGDLKANRHFIVMPRKPLKFRFVERSNE